GRLPLGLLARELLDETLGAAEALADVVLLPVTARRREDDRAPRVRLGEDARALEQSGDARGVLVGAGDELARLVGADAVPVRRDDDRLALEVAPLDEREDVLLV